MNELKTQFENAYNTVFDKNGNITACGRESCKTLILAANKLKSISADSVTYGDPSTGVIKVDEMKALHSETVSS